MQEHLQVGDQVVYRESRRNTLGGANQTMVRVGTILSFEGENNSEAKVLFASANGPSAARRVMSMLTDGQSAHKVVKVSELQSSSSQFGGGRKVVQINPNLRAIGSLINK